MGTAKLTYKEVTLAKAATRVNDLHRKVAAGMRTTLKAAWDAGDALTEARVLLGHGKWRDWLDENFEARESVSA